MQPVRNLLRRDKMPLRNMQSRSRLFQARDQGAGVRRRTKRDGKKSVSRRWSLALDDPDRSWPLRLLHFDKDRSKHGRAHLLCSEQLSARSTGIFHRKRKWAECTRSVSFSISGYA